jgi:hypothetical protein
VQRDINGDWRALRHGHLTHDASQRPRFVWSELGKVEQAFLLSQSSNIFCQGGALFHCYRSWAPELVSARPIAKMIILINMPLSCDKY